MATGCQAIDARRFGPSRLRGAQPSSPRHPCQDRIERARAEAITMMVQLFQHPLTVNPPPVSGMVEDMNLPEREEKFTGNRIAHAAVIISLAKFVVGYRLRRVER
jgi:hypothetical protein